MEDFLFSAVVKKRLSFEIITLGRSVELKHVASVCIHRGFLFGVHFEREDWFALEGLRKSTKNISQGSRTSIEI
jgi:hypothetical protein